MVKKIKIKYMSITKRPLRFTTTWRGAKASMAAYRARGIPVTFIKSSDGYHINTRAVFAERKSGAFRRGYPSAFKPTTNMARNAVRAGFVIGKKAMRG